MFYDWVPESARFWIYMFFLMAFQFSNGIYFCAMSQVEGGLSFTMNDVKMLTHASFVGMTMYFPLAFRLKFAYAPKTCLLVPAAVVILCNLLAPHVHSFPVMLGLCLVTGFFRLFGTFECLSGVLPKIAPTHNYALFLSFVFCVVLGVVQLFDVIGAYTIYYHAWTYVHYMAVALLLLIVLGACWTVSSRRVMPHIPLYGVDWWGMALWTIFILSLIFAAQYGNQLEWLDSRLIRAAFGAAFLALGFNVLRMTYFRHPFLEFKAFATKNLANLWILFLFLGILLAVQNVLQNTFTGGLLHFDALNTATLKCFEFLGMFVAAVFSWFALTKLKWSNKLVLLAGMGVTVLYVVMLYGLVSPHTNIEKLYLPVALVGFGHVAVFITLTVYAQANAPFKNYFQVLCILGLMRTGLASPLGDALYTRALQGTMQSYLAQIGSQLQPSVQQVSWPLIQTQALAASLRELLGWSIVFGVLVLVLILLSHFRKGAYKVIPTLRALYRAAQKNARAEAGR